MNDKERLEEIKQKYQWAIKRSLANRIDDSDIEWLIQQAERVQELEKENRRYRKVINNIIEKAMLFGVDEQVFEAIKEANRVLEGEE
ncbi:hypothetical protein [Aeribacillus sp. FSL M8-0235]|uniref:hypothetical protein n=1 Tax=Aeribacillus sp. FSL M8-0235 TaxID=2954576 RepID=UPI0030F76B19